MTTLICDSKQLKKISAISSSLDTLKYIVYFEDEGTPISSDISAAMGDLIVSSFSEVEELGKGNPSHPRLPVSDDVAVIMYTSGSTGLPKVCFSLLFPHL